MTNDDLYRFAQRALLTIGEETVAKQFSISWNPRMRSTAGRALLKTYNVEINPKLLEFGENEVYNTILHELAHLLAWYRTRHRGHGAEWRAACVDLGIPNEKVTHNLPLPKRQQKRKWRYVCPACETSFDRVRKARAHSACAKCCKEFNKGRYSRRYLLKEYLLSEGDFWREKIRRIFFKTH